MMAPTEQEIALDFRRDFAHPTLAERMLGIVILVYIALAAFASCTVALVAIFG